MNASAKVNQGYFFRFNIEGVSLLLSHVSPTDRLAAWLEQIRSAGESDADDVATRLAEPARFSAHRRRERNPQLASAAKRIHGYACQVCHFDFSQAYGDIGIGYIEAHHVVPLSQLDPAEEVVLSPEDDFAVVCANCHRMLHRKPYPSVEELREAVEARRSK